MASFQRRCTAAREGQAREGQGAGGAGRGQAGLAISESADFHDHEDFYTPCGIKVFAIMKFSLLSSD
jgi:hypothetical protein